MTMPATRQAHRTELADHDRVTRDSITETNECPRSGVANHSGEFRGEPHSYP